MDAMSDRGACPTSRARFLLISRGGVRPLDFPCPLSPKGESVVQTNIPLLRVSAAFSPLRGGLRLLVVPLAQHAEPAKEKGFFVRIAMTTWKPGPDPVIFFEVFLSPP